MKKVKEDKEPHIKASEVTACCLLPGRGVYHISSFFIIVFTVQLAFYQLIFYGISKANIMQLAGVGACIFASVMALFTYVNCIFIGKKRTIFYLLFVILAIAGTTATGIIAITGVNNVDDRLAAYWNNLSDDAKSDIASKYGCCGLTQVTADCSANSKVPCSAILTPLYTLGDQLFAIGILSISGLQLLNGIMIIITTRMFHKAKHSKRDALRLAEEGDASSATTRKIDPKIRRSTSSSSRTGTDDLEARKSLHHKVSSTSPAEHDKSVKLSRTERN